MGFFLGTHFIKCVHTLLRVCTHLNLGCFACVYRCTARILTLCVCVCVCTVCVCVYTSLALLVSGAPCRQWHTIEQAHASSGRSAWARPCPRVDWSRSPHASRLVSQTNQTKQKQQKRTPGGHGAGRRGQPRPVLVFEYPPEHQRIP